MWRERKKKRRKKKKKKKRKKEKRKKRRKMWKKRYKAPQRVQKKSPFSLTHSCTEPKVGHCPARLEEKHQVFTRCSAGLSSHLRHFLICRLSVYIKDFFFFSFSLSFPLSSSPSSKYVVLACLQLNEKRRVEEDHILSIIPGCEITPLWERWVETDKTAYRIYFRRDYLPYCCHMFGFSFYSGFSFSLDVFLRVVDGLFVQS